MHWHWAQSINPVTPTLLCTARDTSEDVIKAAHTFSRAKSPSSKATANLSLTSRNKKNLRAQSYHCQQTSKTQIKPLPFACHQLLVRTPSLPLTFLQVLICTAPRGKHCSASFLNIDANTMLSNGIKVLPPPHPSEQTNLRICIIVIWPSCFFFSPLFSLYNPNAIQKENRYFQYIPPSKSCNYFQTAW